MKRTKTAKKPPKPTGRLLPYQEAHARALMQALTTTGRALDASDAGLGKTYTAAKIAADLGCPTYIVGLKSVLPAWEKVAASFGVDTVGIINYEKLIRGVEGVYDKSTLLGEWQLPEGALLIFDEVHKCKGRTTQNAKLLRAAARMISEAVGSGYKVLMLSATCANSPLDMSALGEALGLFKGSKGFWRFACEHGVEQGFYGMEFSGCQEDIEDIHSLIFPHLGSRMRIKDIPDFPETIIDVKTIRSSKAKKLQAEYDDLKYRARAAEMSSNWVLKWASAQELDAKAPSVLTALLRNMQAMETAKIPYLVDAAKDALESGRKVTIFVNYQETIDLLLEAFKSKKTGVIIGGQKPSERQKVIDDFQANLLDIVICNIKAGGVGVSLHDPTGEIPRFSLICACFSAIDLIQVFGRVRRAGGASSVQEVIYLQGTYEERVASLVSSKIKNIQSLNDGDTCEQDIFREVHQLDFENLLIPNTQQ